MIDGAGWSWLLSKCFARLAVYRSWRYTQSVKELRALTPEEFERAAERLRNPAPGSRIEAAKKFGTDLTLLIEQLRLSPEDRLRKLQQTADSLAQVRGIVSRRS